MTASPQTVITSKGRSEEAPGRDVMKECDLSINKPMGIAHCAGTEEGWVN